MYNYVIVIRIVDYYNNNIMINVLFNYVSFIVIVVVT